MTARRAVLLDALGTLVSFADPVARLRSLLHERHGVEVSIDEARTALRAEMAAYRRLNAAARDRAGLAELRRTCAGILRGELSPARAIALDDLVPTLVDMFRFEPYAEVPEVLDELRARGRRLAVVSNWDVSLHDVLAGTGLSGRVDAVVASAELGVAKPDPAPFHRALDLLGASAAEALHAGDRIDEDVQGARAAGVEPVLVDRERAGAPRGVRAVADLAGLLELEA